MYAGCSKQACRRSCFMWHSAPGLSCSMYLSIHELDDVRAASTCVHAFHACGQGGGRVTEGVLHNA
eukprot:11223192-Lingulodinium_polyedra.AAC.1